MPEPKPAIGFRDLVSFASQNLRDSSLRAALTTAGIAVGIASLVAMLSLGIGLQQLAMKRLVRSGMFDTMIVTSKEFDRMGRSRPRPGEKDEGPARPLNDAARKEFASLPNVAEVYPEIRFMAEVRAGQRSDFGNIASLPMSAQERDVFDGLKGKYFSAPDANELILSKDVAKLLSDNPDSLIGSQITLQYAAKLSNSNPDEDPIGPALMGGGFSVNRKQRSMKVVGILDGDPDAGLRGVGRARAFVPTATAEALNVMQGSDLREVIGANTTGSTYLALSVRVNKPAQVQAVQDAVKKAGFNAWSILDAAKSLRTFFTVVDAFLLIFGSLALAVASLGIVNTLVMAILERRHEIGVMKAVGASQADIRRIFFAEAGAMGLFGGLAGVFFGWGLGRVINAGFNAWMRSREMNGDTFWFVPWWLVLGGIVFAVLVSLAAGVYPASRAAKLDPIAALRYE